MKNDEKTMGKRFFGYARVSTKKQHEDRQLHALEEFGVQKEGVFVDKASGKDFDRPAYLRILAKLRPGDVLVLPSIDRLGRNYTEIIDQWRLVTKEMSVDVVILDMPLLDTRKKIEGELLNTFVADMVLQLMSYVAQNEREMLKVRQREGIDAARRKGVRFGRPPKKTPAKFYPLYRAWKEDDISAIGAARALGVAARTFMRWAGEEDAVVRESNA